MLTYTLPRELIAKYPCQPRDAARLLVLKSVPGTQPENRYRVPIECAHHRFHELPTFLSPGDCLVLNDVRVNPARIFGKRADTGGRVELLLLGWCDAHGAANCGRADDGSWMMDHGKDKSTIHHPPSIYRCLGRPARRLRPGVRLVFNHGMLEAEVVTPPGCHPHPGGVTRHVRFFGKDVEKTLQRLGEIPLPPYLGRPVEAGDADWYQTVFARHPGAVAAPTAGLHFTPELLARIRAQGVQVAFVTLQVGWGTFKPLREEELRSGRLYPERYHVPAETAEMIAKTKQAGKRVIAVGTTVVRALESFARQEVACPALHEPAGRGRNDVPATSRVLKNPRGGSLLKKVADARRAQATAEAYVTYTPHKGAQRTTKQMPLFQQTASNQQLETDLFIRPPFDFKVVDALVTNFHLPGTSLLLLTAAFAGEQRLLAAYEEAVRQRYRFYSYGDAMLILGG